MHDQLTKVDIQKMQEEIDYRLKVTRPAILDALNLARSYGDLSENYEYKTAKQDLRECDSRLRYLQSMINTATVVELTESENEVGLFDRVTLYFEEDDEEEVYQVTTTLRQNALENRISNASPLGKALLGKQVGARVLVKVDDNYSYYVVIRSIEKGEDDASIPIQKY